MVVQWRVVAVSRRSRAVPSSVDVVDQGVVLCCGNSGDVGRSFFFLYPLSLLALSLGSGEWWMATRWRRGTGERLGI